MNPGYRDDRSRGCQEHGARSKEHEDSDKPTRDASPWSKVAHDNQDRVSPLGQADKIRSDIRAEYFKLPPDQRTIRNQRNNAFGARTRHLEGPSPKQHDGHANTRDQEGKITAINPLSQPDQAALRFHSNLV